MRRVLLMTAGLALAASVGFTGVASGATISAAHVKPGGVWTSEANGAGCEVQTFAKGHTWTSDKGGDAGTYTGGGKKITEKWTTGGVPGLTFVGTYSKATKTYNGRFGSVTGQLVKGRVATFNGSTC